MSQPPRPPSPWDPVPRHEPEVEAARVQTEPPLDKGQNPVWAVGGTLLFAAAIWYFSGSLIIAVALIFGLLVHEYGHVLAMNRLGMGPARIYIIPLLGGVARAQRGPRSEWDGVIVSMAGPLFGLLATLPFFGLYWALGGSAWLIAVFVIAMINLINLAPAPPLDGSKAIGPVLAKVHPWLEQGVMLLIGGVVIAWGLSRGSYIFAVFLALALFSHLQRGPREPSGRPLSNAESIRSIGLFLATAVLCSGVALLAGTLAAGNPIEGLAMFAAYFGITR